jgi:flagellar hook-associated protein 1 FlgK
MSGLFGTLNVANKGMQAAQTAFHTIGHNISNAETEGFSRQRVELQADLAYTLGGVGQLGTGVKMSGILRVVDDYVTRQIRGENGTFNKFTAKSEVLEQMEIIFNEPSDTSLNFNLGEMFDAWTELSKNPEIPTAKSIVVEKSKTMTDTLNHIANQLESLKDDTTELIEMNAKDFNSIVESLDTLNKQIFNISIKGQVPNDLMDQRDLLLKNLSSITNFSTSFDGYGRVSIKAEAGAPAAETEVLSFDGSTKNLLTVNDSDGNVVVQLGGNELASKSGQIAGYKEALVEINEQIDELNEFAVTMAKAINYVHREGMGEGFENNFFTDNDGGEAITAANIKVNQVLQDDNSKVNVGATSASLEGDGSRALAIARVRNIKLSSGMTYEFEAGTLNLVGDPNGNTIESTYKGIATNIGISKQQSDNMVSNQEVLLNQLVMRRESTSGVNIDEEVSNIIKFQKTYDANARVIQVLSEMLDTLIFRTGV